MSSCDQPTRFSPACRIINWWGSARHASHGEEVSTHAQREADPSETEFEGSSVVATADALRTILDGVDAAAALATVAVPGEHAREADGEETRAFPKQDMRTGGRKTSRKKKPVIILHELEPDFVRVLLRSAALDVDPSFVAAHHQKRRYCPRGRWQGRGGGRNRKGAVAFEFAQWDYPEVMRERRRRHVPAMVRDAVAEDDDQRYQWLPFLGIFRASLWSTQAADVLLLDQQRWYGRQLQRTRTPDVKLSSWSHRRREARDGGDELVIPGEDGPSMDHELLGAILSIPDDDDDDDGCRPDNNLVDVLQQTVYDHWLDLFDTIMPRPRLPVALPEHMPEWDLGQALDANSDMATTLARRRGLDVRSAREDWAVLSNRLHGRMHLRAAQAHNFALDHRGAHSLGYSTRSRDSSRRRSRWRSRSRSRSRIRSRVDVDLDRERGVDIMQQPPLMRDPASRRGDENQRALDRVVYMGAILLPFTIVAAVLSMSETFEPGGPSFWVFWAAACPLAGLTLVVIYADKLRVAEVWEEVSGWSGSEAEVGGGDDEKDEAEGRTSWRPGGGFDDGDDGLSMRRRKRKDRVDSIPASLPALQAPQGRLYSRPAFARYHGEEVVIDFEGNEGQQQHQAENYGRPSLPPSLEGWGNDVEEKASEQGEGRAEEDDGEVVVVRPTDGTRPHAWRKKQLGWAGAARCIVTLHTPQTVDQGLPPRPKGARYERVAVRKRRSWERDRKRPVRLI